MKAEALVGGFGTECGLGREGLALSVGLVGGFGTDTLHSIVVTMDLPERP
jgi:hypothetical protein